LWFAFCKNVLLEAKKRKMIVILSLFAVAFSQGPGQGISKSTWAATNTTVGQLHKTKFKSFSFFFVQHTYSWYAQIIFYIRK
jgi:hypothetical protein